MSADRWMTELQVLLRELEAVTAASQTLPPVFTEEVDSQLVHIRLGVAGSLFRALQCKNAAVAGHSMRVALTCSAWALKMDLPEAERDAIEVAALLHDVGTIGGAGPHFAQGGHAGFRRGGRHGPHAENEPGYPPLQLHVAASAGDRREHLGLVRRQPARFPALRPADSAGRADDRHRRGFRRHDHRPHLPPGPIAGAGDGRTVRMRGPAVRSRADPAVCRVSPGGSDGDSLGGGPSLAAIARARPGRFLLGVERGPSTRDGARRRRALPGPVARQHVRCRGVHRCGGPHRDVEPRGGTADRRGQRQHSRTDVAGGSCWACRTKRGMPSARPNAPCRRPFAAARNLCDG